MKMQTEYQNRVLTALDKRLDAAWDLHMAELARALEAPPEEDPEEALGLLRDIVARLSSVQQDRSMLQQLFSPQPQKVAEGEQKEKLPE